VKYCRSCSSGVVPGTRLTFDLKCPGCQKKKAAGKRTGLEPMSFKFGQKVRLPPDQFAAKCARLKKVTDNKRKRLIMNYEIK